MRSNRSCSISVVCGRATPHHWPLFPVPTPPSSPPPLSTQSSAWVASRGTCGLVTHCSAIFATRHGGPNMHGSRALWLTATATSGDACCRSSFDVARSRLVSVPVATMAPVAGVLFVVSAAITWAQCNATFPDAGDMSSTRLSGRRSSKTATNEEPKSWVTRIPPVDSTWRVIGRFVRIVHRMMVREISKNTYIRNHY